MGVKVPTGKRLKKTRNVDVFPIGCRECGTELQGLGLCTRCLSLVHLAQGPIWESTCENSCTQVSLERLGSKGVGRRPEGGQVMAECGCGSRFAMVGSIPSIPTRLLQMGMKIMRRWWSGWDQLL